MKKLVILTTIISLGTTASFTQGIVNFNNSGTGQFIYAQVLSLNGGVPVKIGTTATAAGFSSSVGRGAVTISLYAAAYGTSSASLAASTPIWTGYNSSSSLANEQGTFAAVNDADGNFILSVPFDGSAPVEFAVFAQSGDGGGFTGWSDIATVTPTTAAAYLSGTAAAAVWGSYSSQLNSLVIGPPGVGYGDVNFYGPVFVPETGTIALGGIGALTFLFFRRHRN